MVCGTGCEGKWLVEAVANAAPQFSSPSADLAAPSVAYPRILCSVPIIALAISGLNSKRAKQATRLPTRHSEAPTFLISTLLISVNHFAKMMMIANIVDR